VLIFDVELEYRFMPAIVDVDAGIDFRFLKDGPIRDISSPDVDIGLLAP